MKSNFYEMEGIQKTLGRKDLPEFFTIKEVCQILKISERTFYRLVHSAQLDAAKVGGCWRVPRIALLEYLQRRNILNLSEQKND